MAKRSSAGRPGSRTNSNPPGKKSFSGKSDQKRSGRSSGPSTRSFRQSDESKDSKSNFFRKKTTGKFDKGGAENPSQKDTRTPYGRKKFTSAPQGGYKKAESKDSSDKPTFGKKAGFRPRYEKGSSGSDSQSDRPRKFSKSGEERKRPFGKKNFSKEGSSREGKPSTQLRRERPYKDVAQESEGPRKKYSPTDIKRPFSQVRNEKKTTDHGTRQDIDAPVSTGKIRLNKFIANSGVCSRREADELITMGLISVNGKTITELGYKVNPEDEVRHESKILRAEKPVYILLNKPKGFLTTTSDPQERNTVMHLIANAVKERVYPVGRLDRNTTGLLLLTNDGDLADKLMHPSYNAKKIYRVELDRALTKGDAQAILDGVNLEEGKAMVDDIAILSDDKKTVGLEIHIGWNRVVRRIFESLNYEVLKLDRSVYAGLDKKNLGRGEWRFLTKEELVRLKHYK
jgi:23S rRNA pseudouridine2605 synthase